MNKPSRRYGSLIPLLVIGITVCCVLRTVALVLFFDFETGYFENSVLITVAGSISLALCVLLFAAVLATSTQRQYLLTFDTPMTYIPSGIVALSTVFMAISFIGRTSSPNGAFQIFDAIVFIFAVIGVICFAINSFIIQRESEHRALFSLGFIVFLTVYVAYIYFNSPLPLNAPNKTVDIISIISFMLFFLFETRVSLGREKQRLYLAFGLISALLCAYSALPSLFIYFLRGEELSLSVYESVLVLSLSVYAFLRMLRFFSEREDRDSEIKLALAEGFDKRSLEIEEKNDLRRMAYIEMINRMAYVEEEIDTEAIDEAINSEELPPAEATTDFLGLVEIPEEDFDE